MHAAFTVAYHSLQQVTQGPSPNKNQNYFCAFETQKMQVSAGTIFRFSNEKISWEPFSGFTREPPQLWFATDSIYMYTYIL